MMTMTTTRAKRGSSGTKGRSSTPTLRTISELTGLSLSTISLSLRDNTALREETRQKIAEAARLVGYVPNRAGVRLRTGKTNVLAFVLECAEDSIDFARHMIRGIGQAITDTPYHLTVTPEFEHSDPLESVRYILAHRAADGVILTHTGPHDERVQLMMEADFPFVTHGRTESLGAHAYHDFHSERFAAAAVERLVSKGCSRILLVAGYKTIMNYRNTVTSFRHATARLGAAAEVIEAALPHTGAPGLRRYGFELAQRRDRPDGIIFASEITALPLIRGLQDGELALGRDIHVVYKQTSDILPTLFPEVDSVEEDIHAAGMELTRLLMRRIAGEPPETLQTLGEPILHWRS
jgi:LacI family transcriptional regulator